MEHKFKIGDELRCIEGKSKGSGWIMGYTFIVYSISDTSSGVIYWPKGCSGICEDSLEHVSSNFIENTMEKKIFSVLVVDKKTGKETKNENVVALTEQDALLKAFGVDSEDSYIRIQEVGKFEVKEPIQAIIVKSEKQ